MTRLLCMALVLVGFFPDLAWSQEDSTADDIEALFTAEENAAEQRSEEKAKPEQAPEAAEKKPPTADVKEMSDLVKLSPFQDVAVIQKRYLPRTGRFEVFGGASGILNDAYFNGLGGGLRFGYYFSERYGIELSYQFLSTSEKTVTEDLRTDRRVQTEAFVSTESFYGADFKWTPVYGKMSFGRYTIVPFDMYFSGGFGMTSTSQGDSEPTIHLGTGQVFAKSKGMAFRWDVSWNMFSAVSRVKTSTGEVASENRGNYNNLIFTAGVSFFFPEATYR